MFKRLLRWLWFGESQQPPVLLHQNCEALTVDQVRRIMAGEKSLLIMSGNPDPEELQAAERNVFHDLRIRLTDSGILTELTEQLKTGVALVETAIGEREAILNNTAPDFQASEEADKLREEIQYLTGNLSIYETELSAIRAIIWHGHLVPSYFDIFIRRLNSFHHVEGEIAKFKTPDLVNIARDFAKQATAGTLLKWW